MVHVDENGVANTGPALTRDDVLTVAEVATAMGRTSTTVQRWIAAGQIPSVKAGNARRIRRDVLDAIVNRTAIVAPRPHEWETAEEFIRLNRPDLHPAG